MRHIFVGGTEIFEFYEKVENHILYMSCRFCIAACNMLSSMVIISSHILALNLLIFLVLSHLIALVVKIFFIATFASLVLSSFTYICTTILFSSLQKNY